jgi:glycosyltransferase involved in cell wall biosynthesis
MVLVEAFAFGTPAAVSGIGPLPGIVAHGRTGVVFRPNDSGSLLNAVRTLWHDASQLKLMSDNARGEYEAQYSESKNYEELMRIYAQGLDARSNMRRPS